MATRGKKRTKYILSIGIQDIEDDRTSNYIGHETKQIFVSEKIIDEIIYCNNECVTDGLAMKVLINLVKELK